MVLARRHICKLALDDCVHLTDGEEDAAGELVLIVDVKPLVKSLSDVRSEHLGDRQPIEMLVFQHFKVLLRLGLVTEGLSVGCLSCQLAEDLLRIFCL